MTAKEHKVVGFLVAGAALVALGQVAPQAAIGLTLVLALGVALTHSNEIQQLTNAFITATGHATPSATPSQALTSAGSSIGAMLH